MLSLYYRRRLTVTGNLKIETKGMTDYEQGETVPFRSRSFRKDRSIRINYSDADTPWGDTAHQGRSSDPVSTHQD